jgi:hypothetical protein
MDDLIVGSLALILGLAVCFAGLQVFMVTLPIWGFIAGFFVGAAGWEALVGDGFLRTVTGWIIGLAVGAVFALLSYFFWYVGAIIAAGSTGALLGSGLMAALNVDADWLVFIVSAIGAVLVAILAIILVLPAFIVVVNTALLGAMATVAGAMLVLNRVEIDDLRYGSTWAMIEESWFWLVVWMFVAAAGLIAQIRWMSDFRLPEDRWTRAQMAPQA